MIIREKEINRFYFVQTRGEHVTRLHDGDQIFHDWVGRVDVYERQKVPPPYLYLPSVRLLVRHHVQASIEIPVLVHVPLQETGRQFSVRVQHWDIRNEQFVFSCNLNIFQQAHVRSLLHSFRLFNNSTLCLHSLFCQLRKYVYIYIFFLILFKSELLSTKMVCKSRESRVQGIGGLCKV